MESDHEEIDQPVVQQINLNQLQFEAMIAEITRRMTRANPNANVDLPNVVAQPGAGAQREAGLGAFRAPIGPRRAIRGGVAEHQVFRHEERGEESEESEAGTDNEGRPRRQHRRQRDNNIGTLKLRIPPFQGKNDPDAYLEWEKKIELVFNCHHYSEEKKVKLATTEFSGYAINWWENIATTRRRNG